MKNGDLVKEILHGRGYKTAAQQADFLNPDYEKSKHNPFLLPDMDTAVERLKQARDCGESVVIYGDYDIDGMTATILLEKVFRAFDIKVRTYTPNRFTEGYGMNSEAVARIGETDADLIVTVDCGSLNHSEIALARELDIDVIVTDHHSVVETMPPAVAVVNPKRMIYDEPDLYDKNFILKKPDEHPDLYPFADLCGCGVAFKLAQALQIVLNPKSSDDNKTNVAAGKIARSAKNSAPGLPFGQEKWLLDLVALGTVCDVVGLVDENRANVKWGLEVLKKTRRPGLKALMAVAKIDPANIDARSLGFGLGPRLNAAGRLETAEYALELLRTDDPKIALELAYKLDELNQKRRREQDKIFADAVKKVSENFAQDPVIVVSGAGWNEGVIGIVASKLLEKFARPAFVLAENGEFSKGSGRSFGDFSCAEIIHSTDDILEQGGGHLAAGGLTVRTERIDTWRAAVLDFYRAKNFPDQTKFLKPTADIVREDLSGLDLELVENLTKLEPFGNANPTPIFAVENLIVKVRRTMGAAGQHVKYTFADNLGNEIQAIAFGAADKFTAEIGQRVKIWIELTVNEWRCSKTVEGRLLDLEIQE
ncbi:MAG: single-stranded-DNA-specific exonuclease RecJ [Candidatus Nomurabacteria bacterium]|nr:single-stranded-DNA-specific exonuclease RecJ [Candidatus Nomurabacteria bacterium]